MANINKPTFNDLRNSVFRKECSNDNLERVKDMIEKDTDSKLDFKRAFVMSCLKGSMSVTKYFLETQHIKEKIDLNGVYGINNVTSTSDRALMDAYFNDQIEIVDYLLFEIKVKVSSDTRRFLKANQNDELLNKIEKRDLLFELGKSMENKNKDLKKTKM